MDLTAANWSQLLKENKLRALLRSGSGHKEELDNDGNYPLLFTRATRNVDLMHSFISLLGASDAYKKDERVQNLVRFMEPLDKIASQLEPCIGPGKRLDAELRIFQAAIGQIKHICINTSAYCFSQQ